MKSAPRVLLSAVVLDQPMGGVRRHNVELLPRVVELLREGGGELVLMEGREPVAFELPADIRVLKSDVPSSPAPVRASLEGRALRSALADEAAAGRPIDLVHLGHMPAPRSLPVPHTHTIHDLRLLNGVHTPMSRRLVSRHVVGAAVSSAARVMTVSELVKEQLVGEFNVDPERVSVISNGCDHLPVLPRSVGDGAPLLSVGHLEPRKNLGLLIEALALDEALGDLNLVGAPKGGEGERLEALAKSRGVEGRVRFVGVVGDDELAQLYAECSACVFPSKLEGFGIGVVEAMRAAAPIAVARGTAMDEVAAGCGATFEADDPADCARAVREAVSAEASELDAARARAASFTWDQSAEDLLHAWCSASADA